MIISTRLHGAIDYAVAGALGTLATVSALPGPVRRALATAAAGHTSYALVTDYEAGVKPVISMQQHLALDALAAVGLCATGISMRRQPMVARALLIGIGLAELAVVSASSATPASGPGQGTGPVGRVLGLARTDADQAGYPPLDTPKPVTDGVWVVDSLMPFVAGASMPVRMTILRLADGSLLLHSPTAYSIGLRQTIAELGEVRHLVAPNMAHWVFLKAWQQALPGATTWAAPGLRQRGQVRRSEVRLDAELGDTAPPAWGAGMTLIPVPGGLGFVESALFHEPSRTLVLTDLAMNMESSKLPALLRPLMGLLGMAGGLPPPWLRGLVKLNRTAARAAARRLIALDPARVIFAHGEWTGQTAATALRWLD
jgi:hypothetical protein